MFTEQIWAVIVIRNLILNFAEIETRNVNLSRFICKNWFTWLQKKYLTPEENDKWQWEHVNISKYSKILINNTDKLIAVWLIKFHRTWTVDAQKHWRRLACRLWELQMECVCVVAVSFCGSWKCVSCTAVGTAVPPHAPAVPLTLWFTVWLFIRRLHAGACGRPPFHHAQAVRPPSNTHTLTTLSTLHTQRCFNLHILLSLQPESFISMHYFLSYVFACVSDTVYAVCRAGTWGK